MIKNVRASNVETFARKADLRKGTSAAVATVAAAKIVESGRLNKLFPPTSRHSSVTILLDD